MHRIGHRTSVPILNPGLYIPHNKGGGGRKCIHQSIKVGYMLYNPIKGVLYIPQ